MSNPTTYVEQFNGSLGDFTGVDPIAFDDGLFLTQQVVNAVWNPSAATGTGGTGISATSSMSRDTTKHVTGPASFLCSIIPGDSATWFAASSGVGFVAGGPASFGAWVLCDSPQTIPITAVLYWNGYASQQAVTLNCVHAGDGEWAWFEQSFTVNPAWSALDAGVGVAASGVQLDFNITGIAFEALAGIIEPVPDLETNGDLKTGYTVAGTNAITRAASSAAIDPTGILSPGSGSLAFRYTRKIDTGAEEIWFQCGTVGSGTDAMRGGVDATDHPFVEWNSNNAGWERLTATETIAIDTEFVYLTDWDGTTVQLQIDGGTIHAGTRDAAEGDWGAGDLILEAV